MLKSDLKLSILTDRVYKLDRLRSTDMQMSNVLVKSENVTSIYPDL